MEITTTIALRDWAVAVEALGSGEQILVMRKGGIHEETRHFEIQNEQFFLFPAFEHQKEELLKPEYRSGIAQTLTHWYPEQQRVPVKYFAQLKEDIEVLEEERLQNLFPHHIWSQDFATERLKWKKKLPLHVLLLRIYRLHQPVEVEMRPEYSGCKSWLKLPQEFAGLSADPVLTEEEFSQKVQMIKESLHQPV